MLCFNTDIQATGCGKTHTISGTEEDPGVIVRTTAELFRQIEETKDEYDTHIELSMVEIYNETIRDLLADDFPACPVGGLRLLENEKNRVTVGGVTLKRPKNVAEVMSLVLMGNSRRSTSFTAMNSQSSRSHAVLQMNVGRSSKGHDIDVAESVVRQCLTSATLSIIDLAGSERASATQNMGARMKEGANINKSLLALSSCIAALCQRPIRGVRPHVPYRNSKLTRMLKFSLGGNCRTVMIVCVSPSSRDLEDTYNTLIWADKAKNVSTKISRNTAGVDVRSAQYIEALARKEQELKELKVTIAKLEAGERSYHDKRRGLEKADIQRTIADLSKHVRGGMPNVLVGGAIRAGWDGAELLIGALKQHVATLSDADEIEYINSLIRQQYARFQNNAQSVEAMRLEQNAQTTIDNVLRNAGSRKFGDAADAADLDILRLTIELQKAEMKRDLLEARESAYREAVQRHAAAAVNVAAVLRRLGHDLSKQGDELTRMAGAGNTAGMGDVTTALTSLAQDSRVALEGLFKDAAGGSLPPLPNLARIAPGPTPHMDTLPSPLASGLGYNISTARALPQSPLVRSTSASAPTRLNVRDTPSGKRLLSNSVPKSKVASPVLMSPKRRGARFKTASKASLSSPAPKAFAPAGAKRGIRFAEEDETRYLTASETSKGSDEWEDLPEPAPERRTGALAAPARKSLAPQAKTTEPSPTKAAPKPPGRPLMMMPGKKRASILPSSSVTSPPTSSTGSRSSICGAPSVMGRLPGTRFTSSLVALSEDPSSTSSSSRSSGLGAPSRPPLNERTAVPGGNTSPNSSSASPPNVPGLPSASSSVFAALSRPTQSSLGKQAGSGLPKRISLANMGNGMPSTVSASDRRSSSTGPIRNERHKVRPSIGLGPASARHGAGGPGNDSIMGTSRFASSLATIAASPGHRIPYDSAESTPSPTGSPTGGMASAKTAYNPLGGGATRLTQPTAASLARRTSTMGLHSAGNTSIGGSAGGVHRGPRASVSMAQLRGPRASELPQQGAGRFR
jgi:kinesin family protein 18/19